MLGPPPGGAWLQQSIKHNYRVRGQQEYVPESRAPGLMSTTPSEKSVVFVDFALIGVYRAIQHFLLRHGASQRR